MGRHQERIQNLGYVGNAISVAAAFAAFVRWLVDGYDIVLGKDLSTRTCRTRPNCNTDQSKTNFSLILNTFLPMRVTCYTTKDPWGGPDKDK